MIFLSPFNVVFWQPAHTEKILVFSFIPKGSVVVSDDKVHKQL